jgi:hypothetical protein
MLRSRGSTRTSPCAQALLAALSVWLFASAGRADDYTPPPTPAAPENITPPPGGDVWTHPNEDAPDALPKDVVRMDKPFGEPLPDENDYSWQFAPTGLIYHSYWAGEHEPRMSMFLMNDTNNSTTYGDATLGGRAGLVRYGDSNPVKPSGYQLDFYGAAIARLNVDHQEDLDACDYVFGFPVTWGDEHWQWKCGYAHTSSHMGDEFAIRNPGALNDRVNYVRDGIELGTSYYVNPAWRIYGETGWCFNSSGGDDPWDFQFGTELSHPGPSSCWTPFVAANGRLREEQNFSGDFTLQTGWLRRGLLDQTLRLGFQYYNGKSNEFEFFTKNEQQLGVGIWYDF